MKTFQTIIYSTNTKIVHTLKTALELLPAKFKSNYRFNIILEDNIRKFKNRLDENFFDIYIIEHDAAMSQGLKALSNISTKIEEEPDLKKHTKVYFIGPEHAKTVMKVYEYNFVSGYIIKDELDSDKIPEIIIEDFLNSKNLDPDTGKEKQPLEKKQISECGIEKSLVELSEYFINIATQLKSQIKENKHLKINYEKLESEIKNLKLAYKQSQDSESIEFIPDKSEKNIKENLPFASDYYFLDIRILINPEIRKVYLRHEIQILVELIFKFLNARIQNYPVYRIINTPDRLLCMFPGHEALKCAIEIIVKLVKIKYSDESVLKNFKFSIGLDISGISNSKNINEVYEKADIQVMENILKSVKPDNTLFVTEKVYAKIHKKLKGFFKFNKKNKCYSFYSVFR